MEKQVFVTMMISILKCTAHTYLRSVTKKVTQFSWLTKQKAVGLWVIDNVIPI